MNFQDFFDPNKEEHLLAWDECYSKGFWPDKFIDEAKSKGVEFPPLAHLTATYRIANRWVNYQLDAVPGEK